MNMYTINTVITLTLIVSGVHPRILTWKPKMMVSRRNLLFQGAIFRFHVKLCGCKSLGSLSFGGALFAKPRHLETSTKGASFQALVSPRKALDREQTLGNGASGFNCWIHDNTRTTYPKRGISPPIHHGNLLYPPKATPLRFSWDTRRWMSLGFF